jgi:hypothetical protein
MKDRASGASEQQKKCVVSVVSEGGPEKGQCLELEARGNYIYEGLIYARRGVPGCVHLRG